MEEFHKSEEKFVLSLINDKKSVVLDLGCGTGRMLRLLKKKELKKLYGLDISPAMLEKCRALLPSSVVLLQHDFRVKLPFQSNFFDYVIATANTLISGIEKPEEVLKEIYRILKKNGKLIAGIYNANFLTEEIVEKYYKKLPKEIGFRKFDKKNRIVYLKGLYSRWMFKEEIKVLFKNARFNKLKIFKKGIGFVVIASK